MSTIPGVVSLQSTVSAPAERKLSFPLGLFIGLQLLDLLTTLLVFARGGVELNPVVRVLMPWTGRVLAVLLCKAALIAAIWLFSRGRKRVLLIADGLYIVVVLWNSIILATIH